jgi:hypothetical protein
VRLDKIKRILSEAGIRQGLPHITTMDHNQFGALTGDGKVHLHDITEKTDGMTHMMGWDEHGFYTQSSGSGSEKMRSSQDFHNRAIRRANETNKPVDLTSAMAFGHVHDTLAKNEGLQHYLQHHHNRTGQEVKLRGEMFYRPFGRQSEERANEIKFVGTSYDPSHMGSVGKYVVHTKLPENRDHNVEDLKKFASNDEINFDDDKIPHKHMHVDVSDEREQFHRLDHELLGSRTTNKNKEAKMAEIEKFNKIKKSVSDKVDTHVKRMNLTPKWGSGSEGIVVHPSNRNPNAPRFKVTSDTFRAYKADPSNKEAFKSRNVPQNGRG